MTTKRFMEIAKMPVPVSLSKKNQKISNQDSPFKIDLQLSALQSIDNYKSAKLIPNIREQLSVIKSNVQKLILNQANQSKEDKNYKIICEQLKQELLQHKKIEEKLRRELKQQRGKYTEGTQKLIGQNEKEKEKIKSQKQNLTEKLRKIEQESKNLNRELQKYKTDRKNILSEYSKIKQQLKQKTEQNTELKNSYNSQIKSLIQKIDKQEKQKSVLVEKVKIFEYDIQNYKKQCKNQKYEKAISEFKKVQSRLVSKQQMINTLKKNEDVLKSKIQTMQSQKLQFQKIICQLQRNLNEERESQIKLQYLIKESKEIQSIRLYKQNIMNVQKQLQDLKSKQLQKLDNDIQKNLILTQIMKLRNKNSQLQQKIKNLQNHIQLLQTQTINQQKQSLQQYQNKFKQIIQKQIIIQDYQIRLLKLQNIIQEQKELLFIKNISTHIQNEQASNLDECFKKILKQNEQLRNTIKLKSQQILQLKNTFEDYKRKNDLLKREIQIQRFKLITSQKNKQSNYEISIQNITNQLDSQIRKYNVLQNKFNLKVNEIKKKDDFIQNIIMGKISKNEDQKQSNYIKKQMQYYFSANYEERLFDANQRIKQLENKLIGK